MSLRKFTFTVPLMKNKTIAWPFIQPNDILYKVYALMNNLWGNNKKIIPKSCKCNIVSVRIEKKKSVHKPENYGSSVSAFLLKAPVLSQRSHGTFVALCVSQACTLASHYLLMCALFRVTVALIEQGHKLIEHTGEQAFKSMIPLQLLL